MVGIQTREAKYLFQVGVDEMKSDIRDETGKEKDEKNLRPKHSRPPNP